MNIFIRAQVDVFQFMFFYSLSMNEHDNRTSMGWVKIAASTQTKMAAKQMNTMMFPFDRDYENGIQSEIPFFLELYFPAGYLVLYAWSQRRVKNEMENKFPFQGWACKNANSARSIVRGPGSVHFWGKDMQPESKQDFIEGWLKKHF